MEAALKLVDLSAVREQKEAEEANESILPEELKAVMVKHLEDLIKGINNNTIVAMTTVWTDEEGRTTHTISGLAANNSHAGSLYTAATAITLALSGVQL